MTSEADYALACQRVGAAINRGATANAARNAVLSRPAVSGRTVGLQARFAAAIRNAHDLARPGQLCPRMAKLIEACGADRLAERMVAWGGDAEQAIALRLADGDRPQFGEVQRLPAAIHCRRRGVYACSYEWRHPRVLPVGQPSSGRVDALYIGSGCGDSGGAQGVRGVSMRASAHANPDPALRPATLHYTYAGADGGTTAGPPRRNGQHIFVLLELTPDREADAIFRGIDGLSPLDAAKAFVRMCEGAWIAIVGVYQGRASYNAIRAAIFAQSRPMFGLNAASGFCTTLENSAEENSAYGQLGYAAGLGPWVRANAEEHAANSRRTMGVIVARKQQEAADKKSMLFEEYGMHVRMSQQRQIRPLWQAVLSLSLLRDGETFGRDHFARLRAWLDPAGTLLYKGKTLTGVRMEWTHAREDASDLSGIDWRPLYFGSDSAATRALHKFCVEGAPTVRKWGPRPSSSAVILPPATAGPSSSADDLPPAKRARTDADATAITPLRTPLAPKNGNATASKHYQR